MSNSAYTFLLEALVKYWGSTGYLDYTYLLQNNGKQFTVDEKDRLHNYLVEIHKETDEDKISDICEAITNLSNEKFFTHIFNYHSEPNDAKQIFVKCLDIKNNLENIEPNRWMSFTRMSELNNFSQNDYFGKEILIINDSTIKFVDTLGLADKDEVLINSNDVLKLITQENYSYIPNNYNDLHLDIDILLYEFMNHYYNNEPFSDIGYGICKKYGLTENRSNGDFDIYRGFKEEKYRKGNQYSYCYDTALEFALGDENNVIIDNTKNYKKWIIIDDVFDFINKYIKNDLIYRYDSNTKTNVYYLTECEVFIFE